MSAPTSVSFVQKSVDHVNLTSNQTFPYGSFSSIARDPPSTALSVPGNGAISPLISSPMDNLANGSVVMTNQTITHPIMVDVFNTPHHHICPEQFHFITSLPTYGSAHRLLSLPMLNYLMTTEEWRNQYGNSPTLSRFMKDWKPIGVAKDPISAIHFHRDTDNLFKDAGFTIRMIVGGRVRMTQINQASELASIHKSGVKKGDRLYIYATKHAWVDATAEMYSFKHNMERVYKKVHTTIEEEEEEKKQTKISMKDPSHVIKKIKEKSKSVIHPKNFSSGHYWVFRPYISSDKKPPPTCLWTGQDEINDDEPWAGCYFYIGKIDHVHGKRENDKIEQCREGLYPTEDNITHHQKLMMVDKFDVLLAVQ